jgi:hypothetical protein
MHRTTSLCGMMAMGALICGTTTAATITPVFQDRDVHAMVIVPPCPPANVSDNDQAFNYEPYNASVTAQRTCDFGHGLASANQHSSIDAARVQAHGGTHAEAAAAPSTVIHAIPSSGCEVRFQTLMATRAILTGQLSASGTNPVVVSYARLQLGVTSGAGLFDQIVNPLAGGAMNTQTVQAEFQLAAGTHTVRMDAASAIDSTVPPEGEGGADFDVLVLIQRAGDTNVDGAVDIADLLDVIAAWGACPSKGGPCLADLDGNGVVNIGDLLNVIGHWGT